MTPDNNLGLWVRDDSDNWGLIARAGTELIIDESNYGTISDISFETNGSEGTGGEEGIMCGLSDEGEVVFRVEFSDGVADGQTAIVRSLLIRASGDDYIWDGDAGNNLWYGMNGETTNWDDDQDVNWPTPPGTRGTEKVIVSDADIVLETKEATIKSIDAEGSLMLKKNLSIIEDSNIEDLRLSGNAELTIQKKLILSGTENNLSQGNIKTSDSEQAELQIAPVAKLTLQSPEAHDFVIEPLIYNEGTIKLAANLRLDTGLDNGGKIELFGPSHHVPTYSNAFDTI